MDLKLHFIKSMTKDFVYLLAFVFLFCSGSQAFASRTCNAHFYQLQEASVFEGVQYTQLEGRALYQTDLIPPGAIAIGIYDFGHTSIFVDGKRIDGYGSAGIEVRSKLSEDKWIRRDLLFVINNPPAELLESLRAEMEDFKSKSRINCVAVTCHYLMNSTSANNLLPESTVWPLKFTDMLLDLSQERPELEIDIYTLDGRTMESVRASMRSNSIVVPSVLTLGAGVILSIFTAAGLTIFN